MLELLLAVLLFSVFMSIFLAATELTAQLMRGIEGGHRASGLALSRTLLRQEMDALVSELSSGEISKDDFEDKFVGLNNCLLDFDADEALKSKPHKLSWDLSSRGSDGLPASTAWTIQGKQLAKKNSQRLPGGIERLCLYTVFQQQPDTPGLYVMQAEPLQVGPLSQPLRLVFCRPEYLCS